MSNKNIIDSIHKILTNPNSPNSEVDKWLSENEEAQEMFKRLSSADYIKKSQEEIAELAGNKKTDSLYAKLEQYNKQKTKLLKKRMLIACLSVASAMIAISFMVYSMGKETASIEPTATFIAKADFSQPTLLVGDKVINLDNITSDNNLGSIKNSSIKEINSKHISYIHSDEAPSAKKECVINTIVVPAMFTYTLELSDGTLVTLNGGSSLSYPTLFDGDTRQVELEGEAFFNVTKSGVPFEVLSHNVTVKAYGTQFNVKHIGNNNIQSVLVEGSTSIAIGSGDEVFMTPGTLAETCSEGANITLAQVNTEDYTFWMRGMFKYEDCSILTVLNDLEQWYGIKITNKQEADINKKVSFIADKEAPLYENLQFIEKLEIVKFINTGGGEYSIDNY